MNAIRPAVDTLRALRDGRTMDELSVSIHSAVNHVVELGKPAEVTLKIKIRPHKVVEQAFLKLWDDVRGFAGIRPYLGDAAFK